MKINKYVLSSYGEKRELFFIDKVVNINSFSIKLVNISTFDIRIDDNIRFSKFKDITTLEIKYIKNIIYSSDNKNDVVEYLNVFINTKKYNI